MYLELQLPDDVEEIQNKNKVLDALNHPGTIMEEDEDSLPENDPEFLEQKLLDFEEKKQ